MSKWVVKDNNQFHIIKLSEEPQGYEEVYPAPKYAEPWHGPAIRVVKGKAVFNARKKSVIDSNRAKALEHKNNRKEDKKIKLNALRSVDWDSADISQVKDAIKFLLGV